MHLNIISVVSNMHWGKLDFIHPITTCSQLSVLPGWGARPCTGPGLWDCILGCFWRIHCCPHWISLVDPLRVWNFFKRWPLSASWLNVNPSQLDRNLLYWRKNNDVSLDNLWNKTKYYLFKNTILKMIFKKLSK